MTQACALEAWTVAGWGVGTTRLIHKTPVQLTYHFHTSPADGHEDELAGPLERQGKQPQHPEQGMEIEGPVRPGRPRELASSCSQSPSTHHTGLDMH